MKRIRQMIRMEQKKPVQQKIRTRQNRRIREAGQIRQKSRIRQMNRMREDETGTSRILFSVSAENDILCLSGTLEVRKKEIWGDPGWNLL